MANVSDDVGVRQRRRKTVTFQLENAGKDAEDSSKSLSELFTVEKGSYWLTRVVFLRCLAFIYGTVNSKLCHGFADMRTRDELCMLIII